MDRSRRGVLFPAHLPTFHRIQPPARAAELVRWFWIPEWDIAPPRSSRQHLIAYPACNLVVEQDQVGLSGPTTRASYRDLAGSGWAVGALLRPAAVPALASDPAALRDTYDVRPLPELHAAVAAAMGTTRAPDQRRADAVTAFADWLMSEIPDLSAEAVLANRMADLLDGDPQVRTVGDAAARLHVSRRTLQRLAARYVGLSPAAMIRRRRLQEAAERVRTQPDTDLSALAVELGYADHAHLAREFRTALGFTPSGYRREVR